LSGFLGFEFDFQRVAQGSKALGDWTGHNSDIEFRFFGKICLFSPVYAQIKPAITRDFDRAIYF
jgi:hypothetical protein